MPYTPPLSACFRPAQYKDMRLFVDRTEELADLVDQLDSFFAPDGPDGAHILVRGERGVGKSMLVRKAVETIKEAWEMFKTARKAIQAFWQILTTIKDLLISLVHDVTAEGLSGAPLVPTAP